MFRIDFFFTSTKNNILMNMLKTRALNSENRILLSNLNWNMSIYVKLVFELDALVANHSDWREFRYTHLLES